MRRDSAGRQGRLRLGWWVLACFLALALAPPVAAAAPLMPDLEPMGSGAAWLCREKPKVELRKDACTGAGRTVLRTTTTTGNSGLGPLELASVSRANDHPRDCHHDGAHDINGDGVPDDNDVLVKQRVYHDKNGDGVFERSIDTHATSSIVGCRYYHAEHHHFHLEAFASFMVQSVHSGRLVRDSGKVSFCLNDSNYFDLSLPGAQQPSSQGRGHYGYRACAQRDSVQGVSIGWKDTYGWKTPGQQIDVTGLPRGDYCVITRSDPNNHLLESNEGNNARSSRYHMNTAKAPRDSAVALKQVTGGCRRIVPPQTTITKHPRAKIKARGRKVRVTFSFRSTERPSRFQCRLDAAPFERCSSPFTATVRAATGSGRTHTFKVRAKDTVANLDPTRARFDFSVRRRPH